MKEMVAHKPRPPRIHVYSGSIIDDWGVDGDKTEYSTPDWRHLSRGYPLDVSDWHAFWGAVARVASTIGWEGDIRVGPYVCFLPHSEYDPGPRPFVVGWKQDNNGITFMAAAHALPWLDRPGVDHAEG